MVFFALTRPGYEELIAALSTPPSPLWVNDDVLTSDEINSFVEAKLSISNFTYHVDCTNVEEIEEAIYTIQDHHPGEKIWVERTLDPAANELP